VISESALQRRSTKTFALQKSFQCSRRGSRCLAKQRWKADDRGNDESKGGLSHSFI
jgi:hypothetical protein